MGENVLFLSPSSSDAATLAGSSAVSTLPVTNLQSLQPQKKWRTTGAAAEWVTIDFGAATSLNCLALVGGNLSGSATLRVRLAATAGAVTSAPAYDSGVVSAWPATGKPSVSSWPNYLNMLRWAAVSYRYARLDIADPAPATTYLEFGRLALGASWQPSLNVDIDGALGFAPADKQIVSDWGYTFTDPRFSPRTFDLPFSAGDRRDVFDNAFEIQRLAGLARDVICVLDPSETTDFHRYAMQGVFTSAAQFVPKQLWSANGWNWAFRPQLRELL